MVAAAGISALGSIAGGLISSIGHSSSSALKQAQYQANLMRIQANLTRELNRNAYQDTTYSMREAGINPMLAISNGINGLSAGSGGSISPNQNNLALGDLGASSAVAAYQESKRLKNETKLAESTVKKQDYESDLAHEQSANVNEQTRQLQTYGPLEREQNLINSAKQGALFDAQRADVENQILNRNLMTNSTIANLVADTVNKQNTAKGVQATEKARAEWINKHPYQYALGQSLQNIAPAFFGGAAAVGAGVGVANAHTAKTVASKSKPRKIGRR